MNEELNRYIGEGMKTFCPDCGKWSFPVIEERTGATWCSKCFPKGIKSWLKLGKELSLKAGFHRYQRKCISKT